MRPIIPNLLRHKHAQQAYANFDGHRVYFGHWPRGATRPPDRTIRAYEAHVVAWIQRRHHGLPSKPPSVAKVVAAYLAEYPGTQDEFRETCDLLVKTFGDDLADSFSAFKLNSLRRLMVREKWTRQRINKQVLRMGELFRWAAQEQMVVVGAWLSMKLLSPLKCGRTTAPEEPRRDNASATGRDEL